MSPIVLIHIAIIIIGLILLGVIFQSKKRKDAAAQAKFAESFSHLNELELTWMNAVEQAKLHRQRIDMQSGINYNPTKLELDKLMIEELFVDLERDIRQGSCAFYKCSCCGSIFFEVKQRFHDVFHSTSYSDGEEVYIPYNPHMDQLELIKCRECGTIFNSNELKEIREISLKYLNKNDDHDFRMENIKNILSASSNIGEEEKNNIQNKLKIIDSCIESYKNKHEGCKYLDVTDLCKALDDLPNEELRIRLKIWRIYNDYYRNDTIERLKIPFIKDPLDSEEYQSNCRILLDRGNIEDRLLLAELNRNLGNFDECLRLIRLSEEEEEILSRDRVHRFRQTSDIAKILELECKKGNRATVCTSGYFEILERKAKEEAERKEQERINEEMKDPRWKVCPNNHCYENIRKVCIWCGEKDVVDRLDKDVCLQHKDLYVGKQDGHDILTTDASIPMQGEGIRKITVDYYQDKFIYFHIDGKDPNPFYINGGRFLTKCCEDIVAGQSDSIDLSEQQEQLRQERRQERIKEIERKKNGITACPVCGQQINDKEFSCCPICGKDLK